jgi:hypothetical protein
MLLLAIPIPAQQMKSNLPLTDPNASTKSTRVTPIKATNVAMHVLQYRRDLPDEKGWVPQYKADVDITLQNVSQLPIDAVTLCLSFEDPKLREVRFALTSCDRGHETFTVILPPGQYTKVAWSSIFSFAGDPATGSFTDAGKDIVVSLLDVRFGNGFFAEFHEVPIGQGVISSSQGFSEDSGCGIPKEMSDRISEPRAPNLSQFVNSFNASIAHFPPGSGIITVTIEVVVGSKGSVCSASVLNSSGLKTDGWIEGLKKTTWFPATEDGVPVTVRFVKSLPIQYNVRRF